jgi:hypothetical protein
MYSNYPHANISIGVPGVTASVLPFADLVKALDAVHFGQVSGLFEIMKQVITLGIDVGGDVMRDLTRRGTSLP